MLFHHSFLSACPSGHSPLNGNLPPDRTDSASIWGSRSRGNELLTCFEVMREKAEYKVVSVISLLTGIIIHILRDHVPPKLEAPSPNVQLNFIDSSSLC